MPGKRTSTRPLWLIFFLNGAVLASWAPRIPTVQEQLELSHLELGLALLGVALGSMPALLVTGKLLRIVPATTLCRASALVLAAGLPLIAAAVNGITLGAVLALLGAASGMLDVAMNATAVEQERATGRTLLPGMHGGYSIGVLTGAGTGALAAGILPVPVHFSIVAAVLVTLVLLVGHRLGTPAEHTRPERHGRVHGVPVLLVVFGLSGLLLEGVMIDWSAVLIRHDFHGPATLAGLGVTVFSSAMALSRTLGNHLVARFGTATVLRVSTVTALLALVAGLLQSSLAVMMTAIALIGLGCGNLFPLAISAATTGATDVGAVTAWMSAWGYLAFLCGPPVVGTIADHLGLSVALLSVGGAAAGTVSILSIGLRWANRPQPAAEPV